MTSFYSLSELLPGQEVPSLILDVALPAGGLAIVGGFAWISSFCHWRAAMYGVPILSLGVLGVGGFHVWSQGPIPIDDVPGFCEAASDPQACINMVNLYLGSAGLAAACGVAYIFLACCRASGLTPGRTRYDSI